MANEVLKRNNVNISGVGKQAILFAHGFGCDQQMWRFVAPAFEDDYRVILFDYVGCGGSDLTAYNKERYSSLQGYAQDVLDICAALQIKDAVFVGHSVSAMIGLLASLHAPQYFKQLVMVGPSPCYINDGDYTGGFSRSDIEGLLDTMDKNYIGWANFLAPAVMGNPDRPELGEELKQSFCSTDPVIARRFAEVTFFADNRADLAKAKLPSLILQCSEDIIAPMAVGHYMHRHLPNSQLKIMEVSGHCPHMSAPEETIALIKEYLKQEVTADAAST